MEFGSPQEDVQDLGFFEIGGRHRRAGNVGGATHAVFQEAAHGFRLGLARMVQPAIFGHAGVGWLGTYTTGSAIDAGISLAFKLVPLFSFGAQAAYNVVSVADTSPTAPGAATKWLSYGAHVAVDF